MTGIPGTVHSLKLTVAQKLHTLAGCFTIPTGHSRLPNTYIFRRRAVTVREGDELYLLVVKDFGVPPAISLHKNHHGNLRGPPPMLLRDY